MYQLFCSNSADLSKIMAALREEEVRVIRLESGAAPPSQGHPSVLLLDQSPAGNAQLAEEFLSGGGAIIGLGGPDDQDAPEGETIPLDSWIPHPHPARALLLAIRAGFVLSARRLGAASLEFCSRDTVEQLNELVKVGTALATVRDFDVFYGLALTHACRIAKADGGSLYLIEEDEKGQKHLHFKLAQNYSRPDIPFQESNLPLNHRSISGHVALTGTTLVIDDVYEIPQDAGYVFNREFDTTHDYRTKSMLTIPMITHTGETVGVLQLVNRKPAHTMTLPRGGVPGATVLNFDETTVELLSSLGGQLAVCLDNNRLYDEIHNLFEGFVTASVLAIEQRDPTTSGHSARVARLSVDLAEVADKVSSGGFKSVSFDKDQLRELRYAALLHDFGKVGIKEEVLVKPTKLQPYQLELVKRRHAFLRRSAERDHYRRRAEWLEIHGREGYGIFLRESEEILERELRDLDNFINLVVQSNRPTVLPEGDFHALASYAGKFFDDADGTTHPYLESDEVRFLSIRKGSLDERERLEVESHVTKTFQFLSKIPWTRSLKGIPTIAYGHHEKLNGKGYPLGVASPVIPVQTRMMTIADIFDALTAADRPYKKAVPVEKALDILKEETDEGMLDGELLKLFIEAKVYLAVS